MRVLGIPENREETLSKEGAPSEALEIEVKSKVERVGYEGRGTEIRSSIVDSIFDLVILVL